MGKALKFKVRNSRCAGVCVGCASWNLEVIRALRPSCWRGVAPRAVLGGGNPPERFAAVANRAREGCPEGVPRTADGRLHDDVCRDERLPTWRASTRSSFPAFARRLYRP